MRAPVGILSGGCVARAAELPELLSGVPPPQEVVLESYCQVCRSGHSSVIPVSPVFTLGSRALSTGSPVTNSPNFSLLKNVFIFYIFIGNRTFKGQLFLLSPAPPSSCLSLGPCARCWEPCPRSPSVRSVCSAREFPFGSSLSLSVSGSLPQSSVWTFISPYGAAKICSFSIAITLLCISSPAG